MMTRDTARCKFRNVAIVFLVIGYASCPIHFFVSCALSGALFVEQVVTGALIALVALFLHYWGILSAAIGLCLVAPLFCH